jgi:diguanylate cyclase (GGDEF)-like protein/PAS domain S-box-containing protein
MYMFPQVAPFILPLLILALIVGGAALYAALRVKGAWHPFMIADSLNAAIVAMGDGLVLIDRDATVMTINPAAENILGVTAESAVGKNVYSIWPELPRQDLTKCSNGIPEDCMLEITMTRSGETRWVDIKNSWVRNRHGKPISTVLTFRDVTERKHLKIALQSQLVAAETRANQDPLTGIYNHRALLEILAQETKLAQRSDQALSFLILDVDEFKMINDTYGHVAGDGVLLGLARILKQVARETDYVGRYGGDEYAAILPNTDKTGALSFANRLRQALQDTPFQAPDGAFVPIRASMGISTYPEDAHQSEEIVARADMSLYRAKRSGGDAVSTGEFDPNITDPVIIGEFGVLEGLVTAVDNKDRYTRRHSEDVSEYSGLIARTLGLSDETCRTLRIAAMLHDLGKIGVPDRILRKPGHLSEEEFAVIKQHPLLAEMIIKEVPNVTDVISVVGAHHERIDGEGYPRGLAGNDIPLLARILAIADTYSALTTNRPYRKALSHHDAVTEMRRVAGSQLDAELVEVFLASLSRETAHQKANVS